ncbi:uncharacterized protein LOC9647037 [Selaginella moellendorffii]|uniref:uncharacterized protein LOC9647037 n=1 Tax=Selaginella moellendorffii TaxID=88036 RepID=UPI000D1CA908|nr:uncharacterized protein LOC9647037 [Selaginella moellendorffii]XP_024540666.1 uncharacterized protein LOC9647037 [Selaginella moellendorffii]|eukprot:XP_024540665.1 uncharacterized protein LOC9647037 [Selaginella moellendorffii]
MEPVVRRSMVEVDLQRVEKEPVLHLMEWHVDPNARVYIPPMIDICDKTRGDIRIKSENKTHSSASFSNSRGRQALQERARNTGTGRNDRDQTLSSNGEVCILRLSISFRKWKEKLSLQRFKLLPPKGHTKLWRDINSSCVSAKPRRETLLLTLTRH